MYGTYLGLWLRLILCKVVIRSVGLSERLSELKYLMLSKEEPPYA